MTAGSTEVTHVLDFPRHICPGTETFSCCFVIWPETSVKAMNMNTSCYYP